MEGLAFNAREDRRPTDAEHTLKRVLEAFSASAAYFHCQLGHHHCVGGRSQFALDHLHEAARLDHDKYSDHANRLIRQNPHRDIRVPASAVAVSR